MSKYSGWAICHIITIVIFLSAASAGSQQGLASDLAQFHSDKILLCIYLIWGYSLTQRILTSPNYLNIVSVLLSSLYFYTAFCMFSDGHVAGWSHSQDMITEKVLMGLFISLISLFTIYIPVIAVVAGVVQNFLLKTIWHLQQNDS
ncbi:hypothetical protein [Thalassotalea sp. PLHSN55]|uniref:hypothetical protein n=1 Tax=Thalassotalea sp. PLHSN55 TaxID=3435888 RepID=UPI003F866241